jgi:hypothetical protein
MFYYTYFMTRLRTVVGVAAYFTEHFFLQSMQIAQIEIRLHDAHLGTHYVLPTNNKRSYYI